MFAIPRTSGWIAQWLEMVEDPEQKIARPRQIYTGESTRDYVPAGRPDVITQARECRHARRLIRGNAIPRKADEVYVAPNRSLRALLVDIGPARRSQILDALTGAGWSVHAHPVAGTEALSAALARRGWDVVIYAGEGAEPVPARKAMALVRMADPQLAFVAAVRSVRPGDLSAFVQGFGPDAILAPDPARMPEVLERVFADAHETRPDARDAHRLLLAQQAITDHVAAGLEPDELCSRVLATLGETLGWTYGAVWRPHGEPSILRCTALWHDPAAGPARRGLRGDLAPARDRARPRAAGSRVRLPAPDLGGRRGRRRDHAAAGARAACRPEDRGRLPDRARRRLRRRARVLLRRDRGARRAGRGDVRHRRRATRPVPRAAPPAGRRGQPRGGDAARPSGTGRSATSMSPGR